VQDLRLEAMGLTVHADRGLAVGGVDEAEDLAGRLVDPVMAVVDAVLPLHADVRGVGTGDVLGLDAGQVVDIDVRGHGRWLLGRPQVTVARVRRGHYATRP